MRPVLLILSLFVFAACSIADSEQGDIDPHDCAGRWPLLARISEPKLLSPTIEERVAGRVGVALVKLESVSYDLPARTRNNRENLGYVYLNFAVLEYIKPRYSHFETVSATMRVGYGCEYIEDDERDRYALAELSADLERFFGDKVLILFLPDHYDFHMTGTVSFHENQDWGTDALEGKYGLWRNWNDGSQWLMEAEGVGTDQDPHFVDPLRSLSRTKVPDNIIPLSEIRDKAQAIFAEEIERGVDCVGADYWHQWYLRSGEEDWYRGLLSKDGTPVECFAAVP